MDYRKEVRKLLLMLRQVSLIRKKDLEEVLGNKAPALINRNY